MAFSRAGLRHGLYFQGGTAEENAARFEALAQQRPAIETAYGSELVFERLGKTARISDSTPGDVAATDAHDEYIGWFIETGDRLRTAFGDVQQAGA